MSNTGHYRQRLIGNPNLLPRAGSSVSMVEEMPSNSSILQAIKDDKKRPGSDSDVLEARVSRTPLHHQDSLMLAYHHRPSVVANHSVLSDANSASSISHRQSKPVSIWSPMEVCKWLKRHIPPSQSLYIDLFAKHDITGKTLLALNDIKLQRIGISDDQHRATIMNEILKLQMKNYMQCFKGLQSTGMFELP